MLSDCCPVLSVTLVYCGQTVGWIKMPLNMEVSLGPGDIVLDGDPALPLQKAGQQSPSFADVGKTASCVYCGQMAVCIRMPLGVEVGLGQGNIVLDGDLASPHRKWHSTPSTFRSMSIVAKWLPTPATVELLLYMHCINYKIHRASP